MHLNALSTATLANWPLAIFDPTQVSEHRTSQNCHDTY